MTKTGRAVLVVAKGRAAQAGIQQALEDAAVGASGQDLACCWTLLDSRFRENDKVTSKAETLVGDESTYKRQVHPLRLGM